MVDVVQLVTYSPEETQEVGIRLGSCAERGDIYLLTGELGAGKTCLTQGIAWGLGVKGYARSPSFVISTRYKGRLTLYHTDLYRIVDPEEAWDLGLEEDLMGDGVSVVEWADRAPEIFPPGSLWTKLEYGNEPSQRVIRFEEPNERYQQVLRNLGAGLQIQME